MAHAQIAAIADFDVPLKDEETNEPDVGTEFPHARSFMYSKDVSHMHSVFLSHHWLLQK